MSQVPESFDHMLAAWNEPNPERVRSHLDRALTAAVHFVDPSIDLVGIGDFEANIHRVRAQIPGAVYSRTSAVDGHHSHHRYYWAIHRDGALLLAGFDVAVTDDEGRIAKVIGFFGQLDPDTRPS